MRYTKLEKIVLHLSNCCRRQLIGSENVHKCSQKKYFVIVCEYEKTCHSYIWTNITWLYMDFVFVLLQGKTHCCCLFPQQTQSVLRVVKPEHSVHVSVCVCVWLSCFSTDSEVWHEEVEPIRSFDTEGVCTSERALWLDGDRLVENNTTNQPRVFPHSQMMWSSHI